MSLCLRGAKRTFSLMKGNYLMETLTLENDNSQLSVMVRNRIFNVCIEPYLLRALCGVVNLKEFDVPMSVCLSVWHVS